MSKYNKKVENGSKKYFNQLSGAHSTQNLVKIHNKHYGFFNEIIQRYLLMRKYLAQMSMEILAQLLSLYQLFRLQ